MATAHHNERLTMQTPEDPTHPEMSPAPNRRPRLLATAGAVVAVAAVVTGIAYAVSSTKPVVKVAERTLTGARSPGRPVPVRGHCRMQAYGPHWSMHRPIEIGPHFRGAASAA